MLKSPKSEKKKSKRYFDNEVPSEPEEKHVKKRSKTEQTNNKNDDEFKVEVIRMEQTEKPPPFEIRVPKANRRRKGKYPGKAPIDPQALLRHSHGTGVDLDGIQTKTFKAKLKKKDDVIQFAEKQAARTELLLNEEHGFIEMGEQRRQLSQNEIVKHVDITSACKNFDLNLDFGPYKLRYTRNGRHLLLGGKMGHVAAFDWVQKRLHCEMNVMEEVTDVAWLHLETMFAVAQKNWVHIYDNQGTELHCLKKMHRVIKMEFLPYHFLLATVNDSGYLSWLDTSIGEFVNSYLSKCGRVTLMTQNPTNGVLCMGSSKGVVSMWSPNVQEPLAKMLCHSAGLTALAVDPKGLHLATSATDRTIRLWDIRELSGPLAEFKSVSATHLDISQKGCLAVGTGDVCLIYNDPMRDEQEAIPYLRQRCDAPISGLRFCPYEDILGLATRKGFQSILVPGAGEANYDGREANPFQTKSQRKEYEVHALLEKIPADLIALDPVKILEVDVPTLRDRIEARKQLIYLKPQKVNYEPRKKMKGKGGSANMTRNKSKLQDQANKEFNKDMTAFREELRAEQDEAAEGFIPLESGGPKSVLDRFKPKKKVKK